MKPVFKRFFNRSVLLTVFVCVVFFSIYNFLLPQYYHISLPLLILYFFGVTILSFYLLNKAAQQRPAAFTRTFMVVAFSKLMLHIFVTAAFMLFNREYKFAIAVNVFIFYMIYTFHEIFFFLKSVKK